MARYGKTVLKKETFVLFLEQNDEKYRVEIKSLRGRFTEAPLRQLARHLDAAQEEELRGGLLLVNHYRGIPLVTG